MWKVEKFSEDGRSDCAFLPVRVNLLIPPLVVGVAAEVGGSYLCSSIKFYRNKQASRSGNRWRPPEKPERRRDEQKLYTLLPAWQADEYS